MSSKVSIVPLTQTNFVEVLEWLFIKEDTSEFMECFQIPKVKIKDKHYSGYCVVCCEFTNSLYLYSYGAFEDKYKTDKFNGYLLIDLDSDFCEKLECRIPLKENIIKKLFYKIRK